MNQHLRAISVVCALAVPVFSSAQSNSPVTRAQVKAELIALEQAGYNPAASHEASYPADILSAEARSAQRNAATQARSHGVGSGEAQSPAALGASRPGN